MTGNVISGMIDQIMYFFLALDSKVLLIVSFVQVRHLLSLQLKMPKLGVDWSHNPMNMFGVDFLLPHTQ